jgi:hypothetical protein
LGKLAAKKIDVFQVPIYGELKASKEVIARLITQNKPGFLQGRHANFYIWEWSRNKVDGHAVTGHFDYSLSQL